MNQPLDAVDGTFDHWTEQLFDAVAAHLARTPNQRVLNPGLRLLNALTNRRVGNQMHVSVGQIVAAHALIPDEMRGHPLGDHEALPRRQRHEIEQALRDFLVAVLPTVRVIFQHPLSGPEARAAFYFQLYVFPVLGSLNLIPPWLNGQRNPLHRGVYRIDHAFHVGAVGSALDQNGNRQEMTVDGRCEFVITRNDDPWCVVELKKFVGTDMDEAVDQAFVYAAAIAQTTQTPVMRAIVTNLQEWRFLRIDGDVWRQSIPFFVTHLPNGIPDLARLDLMHAYVMWFLGQA